MLCADILWSLQHKASHKDGEDSIWDTLQHNVGWIVAGGVVVLVAFIALVIAVYLVIKRRRQYKLYAILFPFRVIFQPESRMSEIQLNSMSFACSLQDDGQGPPLAFSDSFEEVDAKELRIGARIGKGSFAEVFKVSLS